MMYVLLIFKVGKRGGNETVLSRAQWSRALALPPPPPPPRLFCASPLFLAHVPAAGKTPPELYRCSPPSLSLSPPRSLASLIITQSPRARACINPSFFAKLCESILGRATIFGRARTGGARDGSGVQFLQRRFGRRGGGG